MINVDHRVVAMLGVVGRASVAVGTAAEVKLNHEDVAKVVRETTIEHLAANKLRADRPCANC